MQASRWNWLRAAATDLSTVEAETQAAGYASFTLDSRMAWPSRSHAAGTLTTAEVGAEVTVCGWVDRNRNLGGLGFMDIRDHTGLLQVGSTVVWHQRPVVQRDEPV